MHEINLGEAKINVDGVWFSADDLTTKIQEKIDTGDMKFAALAGALEQLQDALDNAVTLEVKILLAKDEYEKLKSIGGEDDQACVTKAISAFIGGDHKMPDNREIMQKQHQSRNTANHNVTGLVYRCKDCS